MRRFLPQVLRSTLAGAVAGMIVVGAVVAVSAADGIPFVSGSPSTDVSVPGQEDSVPDDTATPPPDSSDPIASLQEQIDDVVATVNDLVDKDSEQDESIARDRTAVADALAQLSALTARVDRFGDTLKEIRATVQGLSDTLDSVVTGVADLKLRTAKLSTDGNYSGPVDPSQLTRRLTPADINGNWPLARTSDKLDIDKLAAPRSGCYADYRYNVVLALDAFGQYFCLRVTK